MSDTQNTSNPEGEETITLKQSDLEFAGSILTAMTRQSQDIHNAVEQNYIREIEELRSAFITFFEQVDQVQEIAQRVDLERVLSKHSHTFHQAHQAGWWSEDFNKNF